MAGIVEIRTFLATSRFHYYRSYAQSYQQVTTTAPPSSISSTRETAEERDEGDTSLDVFLVQSNFQLIQASREGRSYFSCFGLLVDTSRREFSPSQIPLAPSIRLLHILVQHSPPRTVKEDGMATLFVTGPTIGAIGENLSPPTTGHRKRPKRAGVFVGRTLFFHFFSERGDCRNSKACQSVKRFHAKIQRSDLPIVNIRWNITQKLDPPLKPSNYMQIPKIRMFYAQKSKSPRRFQEIDPELLHTCCTCPSRDPTSGVCVYLLNIFGRTQYVRIRA